MKINNVLLGIMSLNSVTGMVIRLKVGQLWNVVQYMVDSRDIFLLQRVLTNWLTQLPVQWVLEALSTGIKPPRHEVYYSYHLLSRITMSKDSHPLPICLHGIQRQLYYTFAFLPQRHHLKKIHVVNVTKGQPKLHKWIKADTEAEPSITTDSQQETNIWAWKRMQ
jgi:hypothetical protein